MKRYALVLFMFLSTLLTAANVTSWTTGAYSNNQTLVKELHIDNATKLKVKITGRTEASFDFVYIYDQNNNLVAKVSGAINKEIIVNGSLITAKLISDDSATDTGVTVTIEQTSGNPASGKSWTVSNYNNMENLQKRLSVSGANKLRVTIEGKTEANFDILTITDAQGNEVKRLSGNLNESFIVDGSYIDASFISDGSVTESGFTIHVENASGGSSLPDVTTWTTGAYGNNARLTKVLRIAGASNLRVKINGKTEKKYDTVRIYNSEGTEIERLSGDFTNVILAVKGSFITVKLYSDATVTESGVTVTIDDKNIVKGGIEFRYGYAKKAIIFKNETKALVYERGYPDDFMKILDISNPTNIVEISSFKAEISSMALSKDETKVFTIGLGKGLTVTDISDLASPVKLGELHYDEIWERGIVLSKDDTKAYIVGQRIGLAVIDITNPENPTKLGNVNISASPEAITLSKDGTKAYVVNINGLVIIDITNPTNPTKLSEFNTHGRAEDIAISKDGTKAYIANGAAGLVIIDITDPNNPTELERISPEWLAFSTVTLSPDGRTAYLGGNGITAIDISNLTSLTNLGNFYSHPETMDFIMSKDGRTIFMAEYYHGLSMIDSHFY